MSEVPVKRKPHSPFQNTQGAGEFTLARMDDLINWCRRVSFIHVFSVTANILSED